MILEKKVSQYLEELTKLISKKYYLLSLEINNDVDYNLVIDKLKSLINRLEKTPKIFKATIEKGLEIQNLELNLILICLSLKNEINPLMAKNKLESIIKKLSIKKESKMLNDAINLKEYYLQNKDIYIIFFSKLETDSTKNLSIEDIELYDAILSYCFKNDYMDVSYKNSMLIAFCQLDATIMADGSYLTKMQNQIEKFDRAIEFLKSNNDKERVNLFNKIIKLDAINENLFLKVDMLYYDINNSYDAMHLMISYLKNNEDVRKSIINNINNKS